MFTRSGRTSVAAQAGITFCLLLVIIVSLSEAAWGSSEHVFHITFKNSAGKWSQTGFRLRGIRGIITALHGVAGASNIEARSVSGPILNQELTVTKVDVERDLALLSSSELEALPAVGLDIAPSAQRTTDEIAHVWVIGYPEQLSLWDVTFKVLVNPKPFAPLREAVPAKLANALTERNSPNPDITVLRLQQGIHPGHSGAPVCNEKYQVLAVANGGLKGGVVNLNWAIPLTDEAADWEQKDKSERYRDLEGRDVTELFSNVRDVDRLVLEVTRARKEIEKLRSNFDEVLRLVKLELDAKNRLIREQRDDITYFRQRLHYFESGRISVSPEARRAGQLIPPDSSDPFALALKAMTEERFLDARRHFAEAKEKREADLLDIYKYDAANELYAGNYRMGLLAYQDQESLLRQILLRNEATGKSVAQVQQELADTCFMAGVVADLSGRKGVSLKYFDHAVSLNEELLKLEPNSTDRLRDLAMATNSRGVILDLKQA